MPPQLAKLGSVGLIGVGYGLTGVEAFLEGDYWKESDTSFYVDSDEDEQQAVSRYFQTQKGSAWGLASLKVLKAVVSAQSAADVSKSGGDQYNLGGTFVLMNAGGEDTKEGANIKVLYEFRQNGFADHPDLDEIVEICRSAL